MNNFRLLSALRGDGTYPRSLRSILVGYGIDGVDKREKIKQEREAAREEIKKRVKKVKHTYNEEYFKGAKDDAKFSKSLFFTSSKSTNEQTFDEKLDRLAKAYNFNNGAAWNEYYPVKNFNDDLIGFIRSYVVSLTKNHHQFVTMFEGLIVEIASAFEREEDEFDELATIIAKTTDPEERARAWDRFYEIQEQARKIVSNLANQAAESRTLLVDTLVDFVLCAIEGKANSPEAVIQNFDRFRKQYNDSKWIDEKLFTISLNATRADDDAEDLDDVVRIDDEEDYVPSDEERPPPAKRPPPRVVDDDDDDDDFEEPAAKRRA